MIWNGWSQIIKNTDHYWCFATNTSVIPAFLQDSEIKKKVKLFISAFHREFINIDKFIKNAHKLQDLGYPVFCKIVYTRDTGQLGDRYEMFIAGLPVSLTPLVGAWYSEAEAAMIAPLCDSTMYAERFHNKVRKKAICPAGTTSFEIRGMNLVRCGLQDIPVFSQMAPPQFLKKLVHDEVWNFGLKALHVVGGRRSPFLGTINNPQFYQEPVMCHRKSCDCEWHTFSEMGGDCPENKRWDDFIKTGKWV